MTECGFVSASRGWVFLILGSGEKSTMLNINRHCTQAHLLKLLVLLHVLQVRYIFPTVHFFFFFSCFHFKDVAAHLENVTYAHNE